MVSKRGYCGIILTLALYILVYTSLLATPSYAEEDPATHTSERQKLNLFNTHEIRGSLKALKSWKILIKKAEQQIITFHACNDQNQKNCTATSRSWLQMEAIARTKTPDEQLKWVNQFFNRWPYRLDLDTHGKKDYWATPKEFMLLSGDCEDYSISKYFALRSLGYSASSLRIVVLKDKIRNLGHAVLAVATESGVYILDNLTNVILSDKRYTHYQPQYSLNENYRWAHIRFTPKINIKPFNDNF